MTGESVPVFKKKSDMVLSSTLNVSGSLIVRAEKVGEDTTFEKIIDLVEGAHRAKPKVNAVADKFAGWYVVITFVGAAIVYFLSRNPILVLSMLLVACADDIAVAIPLAFIISIGKAAKRGIIIKGSNFLETMAKIEVLIVDKTGTITVGKLAVEKITAFGSYGSDEVLRLASVAGFFSEHFSAKAAMDYAKNKGVKMQEPSSFNELPGKGSSAVLDGRTILFGKRAFLVDSGIAISKAHEMIIEEAEREGLNISLVGYGGELVGFIALSDQIRPDIAKTITELKIAGIKKVIMLTGDNEKVAQRIARQVGLQEFHANLLPEDKLNFIKSRLHNKNKLAMVGDGVNDAAALALADVGIAMGAIGSDAAIEAADVALMNDKFSRIPEIIKIGRRTMDISYQNFWIWGLVNLAGLVLVFGHVIGPEGAAAYNFITDFFPLINSARLFR